MVSPRTSLNVPEYCGGQPVDRHRFGHAISRHFMGSPTAAMTKSSQVD